MFFDIISGNANKVEKVVDIPHEENNEFNQD